MTIVFANIELTIDFKTKEEAEAYKVKHSGKGWHFDPIEETGMDEENPWTMVVRRPYRDYTPGW